MLPLLLEAEALVPGHRARSDLHAKHRHDLFFHVRRAYRPLTPGWTVAHSANHRQASCSGPLPAPAETYASAKSLLEPWVVAYGGKVVVSARVLAEPREQLDGAPEVGEHVVAGVARERCEARVVVMQAGVVRRVLEAAADRFERVGVALFAVGGHGLSVERPCPTPVNRLVRLAGCAADGKDGSVPGRLPPRRRPDEHKCSRWGVYH